MTSVDLTPASRGRISKSAEFVFEIGNTFKSKKYRYAQLPSAIPDKRTAICVRRHQTIDRAEANGGFLRGSARRAVTERGEI
jgi:hypothetical protein